MSVKVLLCFSHMLRIEDCSAEKDVYSDLKE